MAFFTPLHPIPLALDTDTSAFFDVSTTNCTLYVPSASVSSYKSATIWGDFLVSNITAVNNVKESDVKVAVQNGKVVVNGLTSDENIVVYNLQGIKIYNKKLTGERVQIPLPNRGVYIVNIGSNSVKVLY